MSSGIYRIKNSKNGKIYIGRATDLDTRKSKHLSMLRKGVHNNNHLQSSYNRHGEDAFEFNIQIRCRNEDLVHYEQIIIDRYANHIGWDRMYNECRSAGSSLGYKHTEETKRKLSAIGKGRKNPFTPEHCANLSKALKKNPSMLGKHHTLETRAKMSESQKKRSPDSLETRKKKSDSSKGRVPPNKGRKISIEWSRNLSNSQKGNINGRGKRSPEAKKNMTIAQRKRRNITKEELHERDDKIRSLREDGKTFREIADIFKLEGSNIRRICKKDKK